jgi:hypothetical protein
MIKISDESTTQDHAPLLWNELNPHRCYFGKLFVVGMCTNYNIIQ